GRQHRTVERIAQTRWFGGLGPPGSSAGRAAGALICDGTGAAGRAAAQLPQATAPAGFSYPQLGQNIAHPLPCSKPGMVADQVRGRVTPVCPWYLPPRSRYEVSQTSSAAAWKNSICATPSLA